MITKAYSVFDSKAGAYSPPFFVATDGLAVRAFIELVKDERSQVAKYPEDFTLFCIGEFDDQTGVVAGYKEHVTFGRAASYLAQERVVAESNGVRR